MRWLLVVMVACTQAAPPPPPPPPAPLPRGATEICEGCVGELSGFRVGVANIFDRSLPAPDGGPTAMRTSAMLALWNPNADAGSHDVYVVQDSVVAIGNDSYRVLRIDYPRAHPGRIALVPFVSRP